MFDGLMCYQAIIIGIFRGVLSFVISVKYINESSYVPFYMEEMASSCLHLFFLEISYYHI